MHAASRGRARATPRPVNWVGWGGHGEGLRRTRGEAAGEKLGTSPVERSAVNVGTVPGLALSAGCQVRWRAGASSADGLGMGRSPRSSPSDGKAVTWRRGAACSQSRDWNARRPPVNTDDPWPMPMRPWRRVLGIQTKLHQWARDDPDRRFDDLYNLVYDPAVLTVAWHRVRGNRGARSAGVDGAVRLLRDGRPGRAGLPRRAASRAQGPEVPPDARAGGDDPQARRQAPPARHPDRA